MGWLIGLSFVAALLWGIWLGMPRRYDQQLDDIDRRFEERGDHQRVKRHMTFLNLLQRKMQKGSDKRRASSRRRPFQMR